MPSQSRRGHFVLNPSRSTSGLPTLGSRHRPMNRRPPEHSVRHPLAEKPRHHGTTVAIVLLIAHRSSPNSSLGPRPVAFPKSSAHFLALLPIPVYQNPPTMPASASPARASLHAQSPHSLHGMSQSTLHSAQPHTPPCSPTHASQPHLKSCSDSPEILAALPALPSPSETRSCPACSPSRTPSASHSTLPATASPLPPQAQAEQAAAADYALRPSSPDPYSRPQHLYLQTLYPSARTLHQ
jgi:hypothetical protein